MVDLHTNVSEIKQINKGEQTKCYDLDTHFKYNDIVSEK